jgi:hypothetical protein
MIGNRQRVQAQSNSFFDQFLGIAHAVQEAEIAMTVQLCVRHNWSGRTLDQLLDGLVWRSFMGVSRGTVTLGIVSGVV